MKLTHSISPTNRHAAVSASLVFLAVLVLPGGLQAGDFAPSLVGALQSYRPDPDFSALEFAVTQTAAQWTDTSQLEALLRGAHDSGVSAATLAPWVGHAGRLAAADLPVSPVVSRYLQGAAKGIPVARIEGAVEELEGRLTEAAARIDATYPAGAGARNARLIAIDHAAYALGLGVSGDQLEHSLVLARQEPVPVEAAQAPVLTLGILVGAGISAEKSVTVLDAAWSRGYRGDDLERLGKAVGGLGREGNAPAAELVDRVVALIGEETSRDRVFQGLDEMIEREGSRVPPIGVGEDPSLHRGDPPQVKDPQENPKVGGDQKPDVQGD